MEGKAEMNSPITQFSFSPAPESSTPAPIAPASAPIAQASAPIAPASAPIAPPPGGFGVVQAPSPTPVSVSGMGGTSITGSSEMKKKRGRPRKYAPDGSVNLALSPMPISSSIPLDYPVWKPGRGRGMDSVKKKSQNIEFGNPVAAPVAGERVSYNVGANFTPHIIIVNAGEDITMKVMSFSQQASRAVCILSANGTISNVTLRQPTSSGGTLTYEGLFEILSLSGSYTPSENGGTKSISGGMSVSLAGPDGRVVGGGLAGLLVAAGPVQVVVGSFLSGHQQEQNPKKQRAEYTPSFTPTVVHTVYAEDLKGGYGGSNSVAVPTSFHGNNIPSLNPMQNMRDSGPDNNGSTHDDESSPSSDQM